MTPQEETALKAENAELKTALKASEAKVTELQTRLNQIDPQDMSAKDDEVLKFIADSDGAGVRRHEIEASAGKLRGAFSLDRLLARNFVKFTGDPTDGYRYKLDSLGLAYLVLHEKA